MSLSERLLAIFRTVFALDTGATGAGLSVETLPEWDSMAHINLILSIEQEFRVTFTPEEVGEALSFERLLELVTGKAGP